MTSIDKLYAARCFVKNGKLVPHFWEPEPVSYYEPCLFGDLSNTANRDEISILRRLISIGLDLEIEAGKMVLNGLSKTLPKADPALIPLLKSNAADESRHYKGFTLASDKYGHDSLGLDPLVKEWINLANTTHPIYVTALLESSVFLVTLGLMRIVGSPAITRLSLKVAEDEYRHVQVNVAVAQALGMWDYSGLINDTLEWVFQGKHIRLPNNKILDLPKAVEFANDLFNDLESKELDSLTRYSTHNLPFELQNDYMYSSRVIDETYQAA